MGQLSHPDEKLRHTSIRILITIYCLVYTVWLRS